MSARRLRFLAAAAVLAGLVLMAVSASAGTPVDIKDVPKPAVKAIQDRFTKAKIQSVDRETNGDYEFVMKEGERTFDVGVKPDGKLINIKESIAEGKVPKGVKDNLLKKHPGAKIVETEKVLVIDGKNEKETYEFKIDVDGKTQEVRFDAVAAQDKKEELPKVVMAALKAKFPNAVITTWTKTKEGDDVVYDIEFTEKGRKCEADIKENGVYINFEREIAVKDLPAAVRKAVEAKFPKATFKLTLEVIGVKDKKEALDEYEIIIVSADKKEMELTIAPDGKILNEEVVGEKKEEKKP